MVLLNNDTAVEPTWLERLIVYIESDHQIFSCCSKMIRYNERHLIDDAGDDYCILGWAYKLGDGESIHRHNQTKGIFSACAGAAIHRRAIFKEMGYFDEDLFAYLEDVDISYRARIYGYKNVYCSDAVVYHIGSATTGATKYNNFKVKLAARNNIYLTRKNMPKLQRWFNKPFLFLGWFAKYMFFNKQGHGQEFMEGTKESILRTILRSRGYWLEIHLIIYG